MTARTARWRAGKIRLELELAEAELAAGSAPSQPAPSLEGALDFAEELVGNAAETWWILGTARRCEFQILLFPRGVTYTPDGRFRTQEMCPLFNDLRTAKR